MSAARNREILWDDKPVGTTKKPPCGGCFVVLSNG
jgi:hypothetical protein